MGLFRAFITIRQVYRDVRTIAKIVKLSAQVVGGGLCTLAEVLSATSNGHFASALSRLLIGAPIPKPYLKTTNRHHSRLFKQKATPATVPVDPPIIDNFTNVLEPTQAAPPVIMTAYNWVTDTNEYEWRSPASTTSWLSPITPSTPVIPTDSTDAVDDKAGRDIGQYVNTKLTEVVPFARFFGDLQGRQSSEREAFLRDFNDIFEPEPACLPTVSQVMQGSMVYM